MIINYYFFKYDSLKYTGISERRSINSFLLFYISHISFLLSLFKLSCSKKHYIYDLYRISYNQKSGTFNSVTPNAKPNQIKRYDTLLSF